MTKKGKQKEKYVAHIKSKDFFDYYAKKYFKDFTNEKGEEIKRAKIDRDTPYYVEYDLYCKVISAFNLEIRKLILNESFDFVLPRRMGILGIRKKKITPWINEEGDLVNPLPPDWKATMELWEVDPKAKAEKKLVRHFNKHTNGYIVQWYYSTRKANYKWKSAYSFIPCRTAKVELCTILKTPNNKIDYYEL